MLEALLALNNAHAEELSYLSRDDMTALFAAASHVRAAAGGFALFVAFDETCDYGSPNFQWLRRRFPRFYYIDRVVVSDRARGRGLARLLYDDLARRTVAEGRERLVCEVNADPPNPASDAFHTRLGFAPVGLEHLADRHKTVRYWARELA
jgi:predicted GNAT superfamily acetyltransferase